VHVEIPEEEAHRVETQRDIIRRSVANLAGLAAGEPKAGRASWSARVAGLTY